VNILVRWGIVERESVSMAEVEGEHIPVQDGCRTCQ